MTACLNLRSTTSTLTAEKRTLGRHCVSAKGGCNSDTTSRSSIKKNYIKNTTSTTVKKSSSIVGRRERAVRRVMSSASTTMYGISVKSTTPYEGQKTGTSGYVNIYIHTHNFVTNNFVTNMKLTYKNRDDYNIKANNRLYPVHIYIICTN